MPATSHDRKHTPGAVTGAPTRGRPVRLATLAAVRANFVRGRPPGRPKRRAPAPGRGAVRLEDVDFPGKSLCTAPPARSVLAAEISAGAAKAAAAARDRPRSQTNGG